MYVCVFRNGSLMYFLDVCILPASDNKRARNRHWDVKINLGNASLKQGGCNARQGLCWVVLTAKKERDVAPR